MRRRCTSPRTMMWSKHSRRIDPISRSAKPFCQGEAGAVDARYVGPAFPLADPFPLEQCLWRRQAKYGCTINLFARGIIVGQETISRPQTRANLAGPGRR